MGIIKFTSQIGNLFPQFYQLISYLLSSIEILLFHTFLLLPLQLKDLLIGTFKNHLHLLDLLRLLKLLSFDVALLELHEEGGLGL